MSDDIDWTKASEAWLERDASAREAQRAAREIPPDAFSAETGSELASARAELFDAIQDCLDLGYLRKAHVSAFLARRLKKPKTHVAIGMLLIDDCEKAVTEVNRFLDRKLAVDNLLGPEDEAKGS